MKQKPRFKLNGSSSNAQDPEATPSTPHGEPGKPSADSPGPREENLIEPGQLGMIPEPAPTDPVHGVEDSGNGTKPIPADADTIEILHGPQKGKLLTVHPVAKLFFPRPDAAVREAMKASLERYGQLEPIVVHRDYLLDGRLRLELLNELGRAPAVIRFTTLKPRRPDHEPRTHKSGQLLFPGWWVRRTAFSQGVPTSHTKIS